MTYEEIKLRLLEDGIRSYKIFQGIKIYSHTVKTEDEQKQISKRVYLTKKQHYVYYERTDPNWYYWNKDRENANFDPSDINENTLFEVADDLESLTKYLGKDIIHKLAEKVQHGEVTEYLDI